MVKRCLVLTLFLVFTLSCSNGTESPVFGLPWGISINKARNILSEKNIRILKEEKREPAENVYYRNIKVRETHLGYPANISLTFGNRTMYNPFLDEFYSCSAIINFTDWKTLQSEAEKTETALSEKYGASKIDEKYENIFHWKTENMDIDMTIVYPDNSVLIFYHYRENS